MDERSIGLLIVTIGGIAVLVGLLVMTGALSWFGRLPGDISYHSGNIRVYVPITTMIIVSVIVSLVLFIARRLF